MKKLLLLGLVLASVSLDAGPCRFGLRYSLGVGCVAGRDGCWNVGDNCTCSNTGKGGSCSLGEANTQPFRCVCDSEIY